MYYVVQIKMILWLSRFGYINWNRVWYSAGIGWFGNRDSPIDLMTYSFLNSTSRYSEADVGGTTLT